MSLASFFISDLHLEESRPEITRAFLDFITLLRDEADTLYILGDLFEAWIGDDENTSLQLSIKNALRQLTDNGVSVFFIHGNRDFLIGHLFAEETGIQILKDPTFIQLYGEPVLLMHGDSLCTLDEEYMKFRENIRNPDAQHAFLQRSLSDRQKTARQLRAISQFKNQGKEKRIMDVTPEEVIKIMDHFRASTLIHGHTHRPARHPVTRLDGAQNTERRILGERIVLGDWGERLWYLKVCSSTQKLLLNQPIPSHIPTPLS